MKTIFFYFSLSLLIVLNYSCMSSSKDDDDITPDSKTGVHKIVMSFSGGEEVTYIASFTGSTGKTQAKLYDTAGDYQGTTYIARGDVRSTKEVVCYTNDSATLLSSTLNVTCINPGSKISFTVTAYINNKVVDKVTKSISFTESVKSESVTLSTGNSI